MSSDDDPKATPTTLRTKRRKKKIASLLAVGYTFQSEERKERSAAELVAITMADDDQQAGANGKKLSGSAEVVDLTAGTTTATVGSTTTVSGETPSRMDSNGNSNNNKKRRGREGGDGTDASALAAFQKKRGKADPAAAGATKAAAPTASPIKLFATLSDVHERKRHPNDRNHWSRTQCLTMREMLGFDDSGGIAGGGSKSIDFVVISNFLVDGNFLLDEIPELVSIGKVVLFYGVASTSFAPWEAMARGGGGGGGARSPSFEAIRLDPSEPSGCSANPTEHRIPFGCHHTKMFLVGFSDGTLRVIVHTANLQYNDIHVKAQGAYVQDFPLKGASAAAAAVQSSDFEDTLVSYLATYSYGRRHRWSGRGAREETLLELVRKYDFSSAQAVLVPSTPGYHELDGGGRNCDLRGHLKLRDAVARHGGGGSSSSASARATSEPIVCQFSSIGSLTEKYLLELQRSMDANGSSAEQAHKQKQQQTSAPANPYRQGRGKSTTPTAAAPLTLQLVYPTVDEVRSSVEGYVGGASVPGHFKNVSKPFLHELFRKWSPTPSTSPAASNPLWKGKNIPHIKTYYQFADAVSLDWFMISSHNMSKAAFGDVQNSSKYRERRLFVRSWELGVFISPRLLQRGCAGGPRRRLLPWTPDAPADAITVPLPFKASPDAYGASDEPWACDRRYMQPDKYGRHSVQG